ncbi:glycoside hydrolase domain-containing protein [Cellulomonas sp. 179-A 9B4 NHS]|uniref:glycoside hydrolase domain-containing protein n=1 Tax=Cellulomonas sp. 179-A 9B4 NHS TaxID=3142379 RepID=UPI0039A13D33
MADARVRAVQAWLNATYTGVAGWNPVAVDGSVGPATVGALVRALQVELGITALSDAFGPTTTARLAAHGDVGASSAPRLVALVQAGLICKGYDPAALDGVWGGSTGEAARRMTTDLGLASRFTGGMPPKVVKSLLTLDRYEFRAGGTSAVRAVQQWVNDTWFARALDLLPCDGRVTRAVARALVVAAQYEFGLSDADATGTFGPTTRARLAEQAVVRRGDVDTGTRWVRLFTAAMLVNRRPVAFAGEFTAALADEVATFQAFSALPATGDGDYPTWAQLLVSTGDVNRPGTAVDCITEITPARAATLLAAGYRTVGRYLTNADVPNALDKRLQPGEGATIVGSGLTLFPIYQENGASLSSFTEAIGRTQGARAHAAAWDQGLPPGTTIYFAVDYDAVPAEVRSAVLPYFRGVAAALRDAGRVYAVGVYGSREVCTTVTREVLARHAFVAGMSTGWSGNAGVPMPGSWAFTQVQTITVGTGDGVIQIDKNAASGRDPGVSRLSTAGAVTDPVLAYLTVLHDAAVAHVAGGGLGRAHEVAARLVLRYLRLPDETAFVRGWLGPADGPFTAVADAALRAAGLPGRVPTLTDPVTFDDVPLATWAAAAESALDRPPGLRRGQAHAGDLVGWGGGLVALVAAWWRVAEENPDADRWTAEHVGRVDVPGPLDNRTLVAHVDGPLVAARVRAGADLLTAVRAHWTGGPGTAGAERRYGDLLAERFRSRTETVEGAALSVLTDRALAPARAALAPGTPWDDVLHPDRRSRLAAVARAFADVLALRAEAER